MNTIPLTDINPVAYSLWAEVIALFLKPNLMGLRDRRRETGLNRS